MLVKWMTIACLAAVLVHVGISAEDGVNGGEEAVGKDAHGSFRTIGRVPMELSNAAAQVTSIHDDLILRERRGEYNVTMAISPGDPKTRRPVRYWAFDPSGDGCWIAYPRSLPGVYFKLTSHSVNGRFPESYFTENGDVVSMRMKKDVLGIPGDPLLISPLSTSVLGHLYDDSGKKVELRLMPE